MNNGYIKLYRKTKDNPIIMKDGDHLSIWIYLLLNATHKELDVIFKKERITLKPGQLITGRKVISKILSINESKVERVLKLFESEQQIEQQKSNQNRLISIRNWVEFQTSEQRNEQQMNNECTTDEQRVNTNNNERMKEYKEYIKKEIKKKESLSFKHKPILDLLASCGYVYSNTPDEFNIVDYLSRVDLELVKDSIERARIKNKMDLNYILGIVLNKLKQEKNKKKDMDLPEWFDKEYQREELLNDEERRILEEIENSTNKS